MGASATSNHRLAGRRRPVDRGRHRPQGYSKTSYIHLNLQQLDVEQMPRCDLEPLGPLRVNLRLGSGRTVSGILRRGGDGEHSSVVSRGEGLALPLGMAQDSRSYAQARSNLV